MSTTNNVETRLGARAGIGSQEMRGALLGLIRGLRVVPPAALLVISLFLASGRIHLSQTGRQFLIALVYSTLIGMPSAMLLTWISIRYTERFPRTILLMQAAVLFFMATAGCIAGAALLEAVGVADRGSFWIEFRSAYPFSLIVTLVIGLSMTTYESMRYRLNAATLELRTRQVEQERANKLLAEARLSSLESRIHPHFLFNTLNSIAALIPSDPVRAEDTVGKLASLLRFSLNAHATGLVPLSQEIKILRDYLEIERTRFGQRLSYQFDVPSALGDARVPPLALQTLVENSVKHAVSVCPQGAVIQIAGAAIASGDSRRICLEVIDDGPGFSLDAIDPDHGLGNLVTRLELLFGQEGRLEVVRENQKTVVRMILPQP